MKCFNACLLSIECSVLFMFPLNTKQMHCTEDSCFKALSLTKYIVETVAEICGLCSQLLALLTGKSISSHYCGVS